MRIVKEAEIRRNEILDAADGLFAQKGFDGTSTNDILEAVGIARGTLYYHFKSKEDILDALIQRYQVRLLDAVREAAADKSVPVKERLVRAVLSMNVMHGSADELKEQMHKPQNALMHQKTQMAVLDGVTPLLTQIVEDGIKEGLIDTPFPRECVEMIMTYGTIFFDDDMEMTEEERGQRVQAFIYNAERLLGAENGSLAQSMEAMLPKNRDSAGRYGLR